MGELAFNKFFGAMLATLLFIMGLNEVATAVFGGGGHHDTHEYESQNEWAAANFPSYHIEIPEVASNTPDEPENIFDLGLALASADAAAGEAAMRQCAQCHSWDEGGPNGTGPNLYAMMGRDIASKAGFQYSNALAGLEGTWTYEEMNDWLTNPGSYVRGNKMSYAGLRSPRKDSERVNIIAYLASITPNAPAFPAPLAEGSDAPADLD
ncbi:MAG: c-type cytochrome [Pseudomonadota bacterium]